MKKVITLKDALGRVVSVTYQNSANAPAVRPGPGQTLDEYDLMDTRYTPEERAAIGEIWATGRIPDGLRPKPPRPTPMKEEI